MVEYDAALFEPHAPVARVTPRSPESGKTEAGVPKLPDTGADVTLVPRGAVNLLELQANPTRATNLSVLMAGRASFPSFVWSSCFVVGPSAASSCRSTNLGVFSG